MEKVKKVYLPKWQKKFIPGLMLFIWGFVTYENFYGSEMGEMKTFEYLFVTAILLGVSIMIWYMASGKLPAYVIKEEVGEE